MSREQREEMRRWARYCAKLKRELRRRRSKIVQVDTLGEVRRALRILRRVERSLVQAERIEKRADDHNLLLRPRPTAAVG